jgi:hypothetical protein
MGNVLRGEQASPGVSLPLGGSVEARYKRLRPKTQENVTELAEKFSKVKQEMLLLKQTVERLKEQLLKATETNNLLAQRNKELEEKNEEVLALEAELLQRFEDLLSEEEPGEQAETQPSFVSTKLRPATFSVAPPSSEAMAVVEKPLPKVTPSLGSEIKEKPKARGVDQEEVIAKKAPTVPLEEKAVTGNVIDLTVRRAPKEVPVVAAPEPEKVPEDVIIAPKQEAEEIPSLPKQEAISAVAQNNTALEAKRKMLESADSTLQDVKSYLLEVGAANALNFMLLAPKEEKASLPVPSTEVPTVERNLEKAKHLTQEERSHLYEWLKLDPNAILSAEVTQEGVKIGDETKKNLSAEDVAYIVSVIRNINAHQVWHDTEDQSIGNLDLRGTMVNARHAMSHAILDVTRKGSLVGLEHLAPEVNEALVAFIERGQKNVREAIV